MNRLSLILFFCIATFAQAEVLVVGDGIAQIDLPVGYRHYFEDGKQTLLVVAPGPQKMDFRFTFNSFRQYVKQRPTIGKDFVQDTAKKKGKPVFILDGNGGIAFVDYSKKSKIGEDRVQETFGMMGLDDGYVTFTITIEEDKLASDSAKEFLATGFKTLLSRIRSRGA